MIRPFPASDLSNMVATGSIHQHQSCKCSIRTGQYLHHCTSLRFLNLPPGPLDFFIGKGPFLAIKNAPFDAKALHSTWQTPCWGEHLQGFEGMLFRAPGGSALSIVGRQSIPRYITVVSCICDSEKLIIPTCNNNNYSNIIQVVTQSPVGNHLSF